MTCMDFPSNACGPAPTAPDPISGRDRAARISCGSPRPPPNDSRPSRNSGAGSVPGAPASQINNAGQTSEQARAAAADAASLDFGRRYVWMRLNTFVEAIGVVDARTQMMASIVLALQYHRPRERAVGPDSQGQSHQERE